MLVDQVRRFYRGVGPALLQGPLARFGDTAANVGVLVALDSYESTRQLPIGVKTLAASGTAALWRIFLMPIGTRDFLFRQHINHYNLLVCFLFLASHI